MGAFSLWHWLIVALILAIVFGTRKLRNIGEDLGAAVKGFKDGIKQEQDSIVQTAQEVGEEIKAVSSNLSNKL